MEVEVQEQVTQELGKLKIDIKELIERLYSCCFAGTIKVEALKPLGYIVKFGLPDCEKPVSLAAELPYDKFLKYIEEEKIVLEMIKLINFNINNSEYVELIKELECIRQIRNYLIAYIKE